MTDITWEWIDGEHARSKVPGGWLVKRELYRQIPLYDGAGNLLRYDEKFERGGPVFIADRWHKWVPGDDSTCDLPVGCDE